MIKSAYNFDVYYVYQNNKDKYFMLKEIILIDENGIVCNGKYLGNFYYDIFDIPVLLRDNIYELSDYFYHNDIVIKSDFDLNKDLDALIYELYSKRASSLDIINDENNKLTLKFDFNEDFINDKNEAGTKLKIAKSLDIIFCEAIKYKIENNYKTVFTNENKTDYKNKINIKQLKQDSININLYNKYNLKRILNILKEKVIAQDEAIDTLVPSIILNQMLVSLDGEEIEGMSKEDLLRCEKSTILINGESGSGKTLILEELSKLIDVPMVCVGSTNFSGEGYKGASLSDILLNLLVKAKGNYDKARKGIIFFDEIDKLADSNLEMRKAISQELLSYISGTIVNVEFDKKIIAFDTSYITFIGAGAFTKIRTNEKKTIGFISKKINNIEEFKTEDFIKYGFSKEFFARFNVIVNLNHLEKEDLKNILFTSTISPLKGFIKICELYNVKINYTDEFIETLVSKAYEDNTSARSLIKYMNNIRSIYLTKIMDGELDNIILDKDLNIEEKNTKTLKL